jgi:hypothetical protein
MNRIAFLSTLFGFAAVAKAQHPLGVEDVPTGGMSQGFMFKGWPWSDKSPVNNQCPLCGTMAEEYHRPTAAGWLNNCHHESGDPADVVTCDPVKDVPYGELERVTRCKRCNNAFFQEAAK